MRSGGISLLLVPFHLIFVRFVIELKELLVSEVSNENVAYDSRGAVRPFIINGSKLVFEKTFEKLRENLKRNLFHLR